MRSAVRVCPGPPFAGAHGGPGHPLVCFALPRDLRSLRESGPGQGAAIDCSQVLAGSAGIEDGAVAQLGEHLLCKQGVSGSIPLSSTIRLVLKLADILEGKIGLHRLC